MMTTSLTYGAKQGRAVIPLLIAWCVLSALPHTLHAQQTIATFFNRVTDLVALTIPVVVGLGLLFFLVNTGKLIFHAGDEDARREQTKKALFWGILILFVMVSVWGILEIAFRTLFGGP